MGGIETLTELGHIDPAARAIVVRGNADNSELQNWHEAGFGGALAKSFESSTPTQLLSHTLQPMSYARPTARHCSLTAPAPSS